MQLDWPLLMKDGQAAAMRLVLSFSGTTDAVIAWTRKHANGREGETLATRDTRVGKDRQPVEMTVCDVRLRAGVGALRWRVGYRLKAVRKRTLIE